MKNQSVLIAGFINPDLDAYACTAGYAHLLQQQGRHAIGACFGTPLEEVSYTLDAVGLPLLPSLDPADFDSYIICDTSETFHLDPGIDTDKVEEVVDHHLYNDPSWFPNAKLDIQPVGAAATLVVERFAAAGIDPSPAMAGLLYAGIISNTLNFKAKVTTGRDVLAAAWVKTLAELPSDFAYQLFKAKSNVEGDKLQDLLRLELNTKDIEGKNFAIGSVEMVGVPQLLEQRKQEMETLMSELHDDQNSHITFVSFCDVDLGKTYFMSHHVETQLVLSDALGISFNQNVAEFPRLILRKEYVEPVKRQALAAGAPTPQLLL